MRSGACVLYETVKVSGGRGVPKPHERTVSCGEGRRRRRTGEEVSGGRVSAWDDLAERTQVRDSLAAYLSLFASCMSCCVFAFIKPFTSSANVLNNR